MRFVRTMLGVLLVGALPAGPAHSRVRGSVAAPALGVTTRF